MNHRSLLAALLIAAPLYVTQTAHAQDALERGFKNPPASARPHTWWHWINGNISKEGITADLEAMARVGIGGAQIFNVDVGVPGGKTPFMSPQWREAITHAAKEAQRLGIELCVHNCAGWSSSGGPWIKPEESMQILTWSETPVVGGTRYSGTLPAPPKRANYYQDIVVLAVRKPVDDTTRIENIRTKADFDRGPSGLPLHDRGAPGEGTASANSATPKDGVIQLHCTPEGRLDWDAPAGNWTLIRMGHTSTGKDNHPAPVEGRGLECDKLSKEAMDTHWAGMMATILKDMGPLAGKSVNNALIDSYEVGSQNWTPKFREEFQKRRGYDPLPYLPVVTGRVIGSGELSERFLWDLRRTVADLFAENYVGRFRKLCHKNGLKFSIEPYGNGPFDNLQIGAMSDIPMGEFWVGGAAAETIKIAASSAHTTGRSVVGAESFTADDRRGRWLVEPYGIKSLGDRMFTLGVNRYIFHRYAHQPWMDLKPGMTMGPWGMHLERTVTWWEQSAPWLRYIARCQYLLQSGRFVADAVYFCGDDAPNDLPPRGTLPVGYDYDGCDRTLLQQMTVKDGELVLPSGMRYKALVLPDSPWMTPATMEKIAALVRAGATVVGPAPQKSPSLADYPAGDAKVQTLARELWGDLDNKTRTERAVGKGKIVWGKPVDTLLGAPDVAPTGLSKVNWIHRRTANADIYFVANPQYRNETINVTFRVDGKTPELWHPETGLTEPAPVWTTAGGRTTVSLRLGPAESVFVVFRRPATNDHFIRVARESGPPAPEARASVVIQSARYEATDGAGGADVTEKVRALVAGGETDIPATNELFGDPISLHVKHLHIQYTLDGKMRDETVRENEVISLGGVGADIRLPEFSLGKDQLIAYLPGTYAATTASGNTVRVTAAAPHEMPLTGAWKLSFPPNLGAPAQVTLNTLASWTENADPGVRYFSGTASYETTFDVPANLIGKDQALYLDLGKVKNFAEVRLNGKPLETLWKAPFRLDVTGLVKSGQNTLTIRVTNLWPNRLIGDAQLPDEVEWNGDGAIKAWPTWLVQNKPRPASPRVTFTTWRFWQKDSPLLESGLIGPVVLRAVPIIKLSAGR